MKTTALVLGGASCLWADIEAYTGPVDGVVACNHAGYEWPGELDAWVSFHARHMQTRGWRAERQSRGYPEAHRHIGHHAAVTGRLSCKDGVTPDLIGADYLFPGQSRSGSSSLFAAKVALIDLGFDRVVFCGAPMTATAHFPGGAEGDFRHADGYRGAWLEVSEEYRDRMRSMSGWSRVLLGAPEIETNLKGAEHA